MADQPIRFQRDIPLRHEVDVFVAGGGPAGVAAAIAAARAGKSVLLIEGQNCLGGAGTAGLVPAFMQFGNGVEFLAAGVGEEVLDRLAAAGGVGPDYDAAQKHALGSISIHAEPLKRVYDDLLGVSGARFLFHTNLIGVECADGRVSAVICSAKSGLFAVKAAVYIDATGDGDLCSWAGAPFEKGDAEGHMMPGTLCSLWAGVDWEKVRSSGLGAGNARIEEAFRDGVFPYLDRHLPGMWKISHDIGGGNIGHTFGVDGTDERSLTEALVFGRRLVGHYETYYKRYLQGFEKMQLVATGALLGLRETRRIMGEYVLCLEDFRKRAIFADEIGRYSYPVDIHPARPDDEAEYQRFLEEWKNLRYGHGESYGIPYRSLLPRGLANVLVAGRCISSDRAMQGSVRVMPGCYITGQAAGMAAALAVDLGGQVRQVPIGRLQHRLRKLGAFLPNAGAANEGPLA